MIGRLTTWVLVAALTLGLVVFALAHVFVVVLLGLGALGYRAWHRRVGA